MRPAAAVLSLLLAAPAFAQALKPPEPGYLFPPGGRAGSTVAVRLGGYDWTPDVELFVLDPRVKLEPAGDLGPVLVPPPPYWFGPKAYIAPAPLPRERPAKLTLPAGLPPGPVRWAAAGASGVAARTGVFWVGDGPEVVEDQTAKGPQPLPDLPVTMNGRLSRVEEVDRYRFVANRTGPVTCEVFCRRLGVNLHIALAVRDAAGRVLADTVDTVGREAAVTFAAVAGTEYTVGVHDLDFRGDFSYVYRLAVTPGPRVVATVPAAGHRGETRPVEFVGYGVATGKPVLESVTKSVTFPVAGDILAYRLDTPFGPAPAFDIPLSDLPETVVSGDTPLSPPAAVTGVMDRTASARHRLTGKKGDTFRLSAEARRFGSPLDLSLAVLGPDGKELARNDDLPGTTDAGLTVTLPADGSYTLLVADQSGETGTGAAVYRLVAEPVAADFTLATAPRLNVPVGEKAELTVTAVRTGGFKEPIAISVAGLPEGVTVPPNLVIPADKTELKIPLAAAKTAPAALGAVTVTGTVGKLTRPALAPVPVSLAPGHPDAERTSTILVATTLAPRLKLVQVEADGGRKVHRGSTHPAEIIVERLNGFRGPVSLQMSAAQSYQRQGITGPDFLVPADADRAFYPCFMPEWLETTRTSRMELVGVVQVPDAKGRLRSLVTPMNGRITMSIEGAILKVDSPVRELTLRPGESAAIPVQVLRAAKLAEPVRLEVRLPGELAGELSAEPVTVPPGRTEATVQITRTKVSKARGEHAVTIRGTAMQGGKYAVVSEAAVAVELPAK